MVLPWFVKSERLIRKKHYHEILIIYTYALMTPLNRVLTFLMLIKKGLVIEYRKYEAKIINFDHEYYNVVCKEHF